jgi:hypothetical protein
VIDGGRWDGGINIWGYTTDTPSTWDACSAGTYRVKGDAGEVANAGFDTFGIYITEECTTASVAADLEGFRQRAEVVLDATQSFAVEQALAQGVDGLNNKYLGDPDLVSLATNVSARIGIAYLENAIGATGRRGMIHITPAVAISAGIVLDNLDNPQPILITPTGNVIVIGAGYIGTDPDDEPSPNATHDWIFGTGPVMARVSSEVLAGPDEVLGMIDHETNDVVYRAEKLASVGWDGALQVGVLVDWAA